MYLHLIHYFSVYLSRDQGYLALHKAAEKFLFGECGIDIEKVEVKLASWSL